MQNFMLAQRKPDLIPFSLLPVGYDLSWIESSIGAAGAPYTATPTGAVDGVNATFTLPVSGFVRSMILLNRQVLTEEDGDYTLAGSTITMDAANIPESGDTLRFWGWQS